MGTPPGLNRKLKTRFQDRTCVSIDYKYLTAQSHELVVLVGNTDTTVEGYLGQVRASARPQVTTVKHRSIHRNHKFNK